jgi:ABC-type multidrug transport system fused ATPase/permease subunit
MNGDESVPRRDLREPSLLTRAKQCDTEAIATMFRQFLPSDEPVLGAQYLGLRGCWGVGSHSLAAVTPRRAASIRIGLFGEVIYQDGMLEHVNSGIVYQPSRLMLYLASALFFLFTLGIARMMLLINVTLFLSTLGFGIALLPIVVRLYYGFKKSGLVLWIREGVDVYSFADRKRLRTANRHFREVSAVREVRLRELAAYEAARELELFQTALESTSSDADRRTRDKRTLANGAVAPATVRTALSHAPFIYFSVVSMLIIVFIWAGVRELRIPDDPNVVSSQELSVLSGQEVSEVETMGVTGTITATPEFIESGGCFTLQWAASGTDSVAIDLDLEGDTTVDLQIVQASGSETLCSDVSATYFLWTADGETMLDRTSVTVTG